MNFQNQPSRTLHRRKPEESGKLRLTIDSLGVYDWFRAKQNEFLRGIRINIRQGKRDESISTMALLYMLKTFLESGTCIKVFRTFAKNYQKYFDE